MIKDYFDQPLSLNETSALLGIRKSDLKAATQSKDYLLPNGTKAPKRSHMGLNGFYFDGHDVKRCMIELGKLKK